MRTYPHPVDETFITSELQRFTKYVSYFYETVRTKPGLPFDYFVPQAITDLHQGLGGSWALEDEKRIELFRHEITALGEMIPARYPLEDIGSELNVSTLSMFGLGADPEAFRSLAATRLRYADQGPDPEGAPGVIKTGLAIAAIVNDQDGPAAEAAVSALAVTNDELAPPGLLYLQIPAMILAILDQDDNSFRHAIDAANEKWAQRAIPARGYRAGADTLINPLTSTMCRIAKWRGLTTPDSPYIIEIND